VLAADIERVVRRTSGELLESVELVDEYVGGGLGPGNRSLTWRLTFRHPERALRDKEIDGRRSNVIRQLESTLNVKQRTS
jgi:phenylalanyl-tRNA synthetase beta chain